VAVELWMVVVHFCLGHSSWGELEVEHFDLGEVDHYDLGEVVGHLLCQEVVVAVHEKEVGGQFYQVVVEQ